MRVISADSHVVEPPDLWTRGLACTRYADRAPRVADAAGAAAGAVPLQQFLIDGLEPQPLSLPGAAGRASEDLKERGGLEDARSGGWDLRARLADQDVDGIDA